MTTDTPENPQAAGGDALMAAVRRWAYAAVSAREVSVAMLTRRLADKAARRFPDSDPEARQRAVAAAVAACVGHGLVDDDRFAAMAVRGGVARGHSRRRIGLTLQEKGVAGAADLDAVDDLAGALRLLRRRRLGPWAGARLGEDEIVSEDVELESSMDTSLPRGRRLAGRPADRALALLVRNGFALDTARRALAMTLDEAEARLDGRGLDD